MKKSLLITIFASLTLSLSLVNIGTSVFTNKAASKVEASSTKSVTGLYQKVTSAASLSENDSVIFVSDDGEVIRDLGGNPGFLYTTTDRVYLSSDKNLVYLDNAYVTPQTLKTHDTNQYSFYGEYNPFSRYSANGYIAFDNRGDGIHGGSIDYINDNIGILYFKDGSGIRKNICPESSFTLSYDGSHMVIKNVAEDKSLCFTYGYSNRFYLADGTWSNINLYKQAYTSNVSVQHNLTKTVYNQGDKIELSGLVVQVTLFGASQYNYEYDSNKGFFKHDEYVSGIGDTTNTVTFVDTDFTVNITVNPVTAQYQRINSSLHDYRGRYYFATQVGSNKYLFNGYDNNGNNPFLAYFYNSQGLEYVDVDPSTGTDIEREHSQMNIVKYDATQYRINYDGSYYMGVNGDGNIFYSTKAFETSLFQLVHDSSNNYVYIALIENNIVTNKVLSYYNGGCKFLEKGTENAGVFRLYHIIDPDTIINEINSLTNEMKTVFALCNDQGQTDFSTDVNKGINRWNNLSASFLGLQLDSQGYLGNITYVHN